MKKSIIFGIISATVVLAFFVVTHFKGVPSDRTGDTIAIAVAVETEVSHGEKESLLNGAPTPELERTAEPRFAPYPLNEIAVDSSDVPARVRVLFDQGATGYTAHCRHVKALGNTLATDEVAALILFLNTTPEALGMNRAHFNSVGDKVINKLEDQVSIPPELVNALVGMFYDPALDFTWREYCVQHLGSLYPTPATEGRREEILSLFAAASLPELHMAGTAVLSLSQNVGVEGVNEALVAATAAAVALDEAQGDAGRVTAMLVAAEMGDRDMLVLARGVVESSNSVHFRMSSMATIGMLGDASDLASLEKYVNWHDMRLRLPSQAAVKEINQRLGR